MAKGKKRKSGAAPGKKPPEHRPVDTATPGERLASPYQILIAVGFMVAAICAMYPELAFKNRVFLSSDFEAARSFATPIRQAMAEAGGYPLWNPYLFSGMPSYESLSYNPYVYPLSVVTGFLTGVLGFPNSTWLLFHVFLLGFGVFLLLRDRGVPLAVAVFAGVVMMWAPHHVAVGAYGHGTQANAIAYIPYALWLWDRIWRGKPLMLNAAALVIVLGFQLLRAHIQISYYTLALLGIHTMFFGTAKIRAAVRGKPDTEYPTVLGFFRRALRREDVPSRRLAVLETADLAVVFGLVVVGALLLSAVLYLPVKDYSAYSIRGGSESGGVDYQYATSWSLHPVESVTFIVPFAFGYGKILYHGHMPFTDYPNYLGLVVVLFSVFAVAFARSRFVWFLLLVISVTTLVSFGKYFPVLYDPLFKWLPYFNKFRVPVMVLIVQQFAFVLLFAIGLSAALRSDSRKTKRIALWGLVGAMVLLAVCVATAGYWTGGFARAVAKNITAVRSAPEQLQLARLSGAFLFKDLVKTSLVLATGFGLIGLYARRVIPAGAFVLLVGLTAAADMFLATRYVLHPEHLYPKSLGVTDRVSIMKDKSARDRFLEPDAIVDFLKRHASEDTIAASVSAGGNTRLYRVFPGYHPSAPLIGGDFGSNRFMNFGVSSLGGYHPAKLSVYADFINALETAFQRSNFHLLDVMNARYAVTSHPFSEVPSFEKVWEGPDLEGQKRYVYVNTTAMPRFFFVDRYRVLEPEEILGILPSLPSDGIDLAETVLLEKEPGPRPVSKAGAEAVITRYEPNEIRMDARLPSAAILVLSEVFYPKWRVYVDGKEGEVLKADYALRAVALNAGAHEIVFRYDATLVRRGLSVSVAAFAVALIVLTISSVHALRGKLNWKR